jgi:hypothetical protein
MDAANRTPVLPDASNQALFGVISDVDGEDGEYEADGTICAGHLNSFPASLLQSVQNNLHALVKAAEMCDLGVIKVAQL